MRTTLLLILSFITVLAVAQVPQSVFTFKIIATPNNTYGYDILRDNKLLIHQINVPATIGNVAFKTKSDAAKVAKLVVKKLKKGEIPPRVTIEELQKLSINTNK